MRRSTWWVPGAQNGKILWPTNRNKRCMTVTANPRTHSHWHITLFIAILYDVTCSCSLLPACVSHAVIAKWVYVWLILRPCVNSTEYGIERCIGVFHSLHLAHNVWWFYLWSSSWVERFLFSSLITTLLINYAFVTCRLFSVLRAFNLGIVDFVYLKYLALTWSHCRVQWSSIQVKRTLATWEQDHSIVFEPWCDLARLYHEGRRSISRQWGNCLYSTNMYGTNKATRGVWTPGTKIY